MQIVGYIDTNKDHLHGQIIKFINAQQAKAYNIYKNKLKFMKTNAAIWSNKMCKIKGLKPNYISVKINGKTLQDRKTTRNAIIYRINQEVKFLYKKKQHLNQVLYQQHLKGSYYCKGMWQHALEHIGEQIDKQMENKYITLNKKLDNLQKRENRYPHITQNRRQPTQPRIINLTNIKLTQKQIQFLNLGPNYAMEQEPKK